MEREILLSIIIPIYRTEKYLEQCINSILIQTDNRIEIILINNGSGNNAKNICGKYVENYSNVTYLHLENNVGISKARNIGLSRAIGKYVWFFDSDDYIEENIVSKIISNLYDDIDMIILNIKKFDDETCDVIGYREKFDETKINNNVEETLQYLVTNNKFNACAWNKIIRRNFLIDNNINFKDGIRGEDTEWIGHIYMAVKSIKGIDEPCYMYRVRKNSTSRLDISDKCWNDCYNVVFDWYSFLNNNTVDMAKYLMNFYTYQYFILLGKVNYYKDRKDKLKKLKMIGDIVEYSFDKKCNFITKIIKIFGVNITSYILYFYLRFK